MKKQHIVAIVVLLVVAGALGAGYQFYFKEQLEEYSENETFLTQIRAKRADLDRQFDGKKPDDVVAAYRNLVNPWADATETRARPFRFDEYTSVEPMPEGEIPKPYYIRQVESMKNQLLQDAYTGGVPIPGVDPYFGQYNPSQLAGTTITAEDANKWLKEVHFGSSIVRKLMANGALQINNFGFWSPRVVEGVLNARTFGVDMWIRMGDYCRLVQELQYDEQTFFSVASFRMTNPYLKYYDPPLRVEMLVTMAEYLAPDAPAGTGSGSAGTDLADTSAGGQQSIEETLTRMGQNREPAGGGPNDEPAVE
ncbi:MAG: hypothetical protein AMXMBFR82_17530 [Candidatus Hydrogenedentota bacterium]